MKRQFIIIILLLCIISLSAQQKEWSLEECLNHAIKNSITIRDAVLSQKSSEVDYMQSRYSRLPNLTFNAAQRMSQGSAIDPITSDFVSQTIHSTSGNINSQLTLFSGNQITNQINQSRLLVEQSKLFIEESKNNIKLSIVEAYLQVLYNKESLNIEKNNVNSSKEQLKLITNRFKMGMASNLEVSDAKAQLASDEYSFVQAQNNYATNLLVLKQLLEIPPNEMFDVKASKIGANQITNIPIQLEIYNKALQNMPEVQASLLEVQVSEKDLNIAKGAYSPTLSLSGSVASGYTNTRDLSVQNQFDNNLNSQLGLSLSVPIFSRNETKAKVQNALITIEKAKLQQSATEKELYQKIETVWQNIIAAQNQILASKVSLRAAEYAFKLSKNQYENGSLSYSELIISQNSFYNSQEVFLQSKYMGVLYSLLLNFYQGTPMKL